MGVVVVSNFSSRKEQRYWLDWVERRASTSLSDGHYCSRASCLVCEFSGVRGGMFLARVTTHSASATSHTSRTAPTLSEPSLSVLCVQRSAVRSLAWPCPVALLPCLSSGGTFVIHVLSMHPSSALIMPPRASNYLSRPNCLSCPILSPADVKVSNRCEPARAQPCHLPLRHSHSPPPPPADAAYCAPYRRACLPTAAVPHSSSQQQRQRAARPLHPPTRQITRTTSYQHAGAQQHHAENCAIAQHTRGSTTLV